MLDADGPAPEPVAKFTRTWHSLMQSRGADPYIGARLKVVLEDSKAFEYVHERYLQLPMSQNRDGMDNQ